MVVKNRISHFTTFNVPITPQTKPIPKQCQVNITSCSNTKSKGISIREKFGCQIRVASRGRSVIKKQKKCVNKSAVKFSKIALERLSLNNEKVYASKPVKYRSVIVENKVREEVARFNHYGSYTITQ